MDLSNISSADLQRVLLTRAIARTTLALAEANSARLILQQKALDQEALAVRLESKRLRQEHELTRQAARKASPIHHS